MNPSYFFVSPKVLFAPFRLTILILFMGVSLLGCSTTDSKEEEGIFPESKNHSQVYNKGKAAYLVGDYPLALGLMTRVAKEEKDADAMYAVGYMVFYGQGTDANKEDAIAWIRKAAESGSDRAFRALAVINKLKKPSENKPENKEKSEVK